MFLRACIDEALRLSPPGGSAPWREVDRGGATIDGEFFPEGCEVGVAVYTMHHNTQYWDDAFSYTPERWLRSSAEEDQEGKRKGGGSEKKKKPYVPFSMGPRSCVGKPLAIAQMMLTLAVLLWEFDWRRGDQDESWETKDTAPPTTEYELKEHITSHREGPILRFRPRV